MYMIFKVGVSQCQNISITKYKMEANTGATCTLKGTKAIKNHPPTHLRARMLVSCHICLPQPRISTIYEGSCDICFLDSTRLSVERKAALQTVVKRARTPVSTCTRTKLIMTSEPPSTPIFIDYPS